ncbi:MAG: glycosyltransferase [Pseudomonadota bacterium]
MGESRSTYHWVKYLSERFDVTLLTLQRADRQEVAEQLPDTHVVTWPEAKLWRGHERINAMMKPAYIGFYLRARQWLRDNRSAIDLVHQLAPLAMRYPCPATGLDIPYIIGPLGGSLAAPKDLNAQRFPGVAMAPVDRWYARLRAVDHWRFAHDHWLRRSYAEAAAIIGVGDYVRAHLHDLDIGHFVVESEVGIDDVITRPEEATDRPVSTLLHVARGVRTKGLQEAIQCLADLYQDYPALTLISAGDGPEVDRCQNIAAALGVADRCQFLGRVPRERVEQLYLDADIFLFPSVREPSGNVVFEAMRYGLPPIVADMGGPSQVITDTSGLAVPWRTVAQFRQDLAAGARRLIDDRPYYQALVHGAQERVAHLGIWSHKIDRMVALYDQLGCIDRREDQAGGQAA